MAKPLPLRKERKFIPEHEMAYTRHCEDYQHSLAKREGKKIVKFVHARFRDYAIPIATFEDEVKRKPELKKTPKKKAITKAKKGDWVDHIPTVIPSHPQTPRALIPREPKVKQPLSPEEPNSPRSLEYQKKFKVVTEPYVWPIP